MMILSCLEVGEIANQITCNVTTEHAWQYINCCHWMGYYCYAKTSLLITKKVVCCRLPDLLQIVCYIAATWYICCLICSWNIIGPKLGQANLYHIVFIKYCSTFLWNVVVVFCEISKYSVTSGKRSEGKSVAFGYLFLATKLLHCNFWYIFPELSL